MAIVFIGICVVFIVIYKTGLLCKKSAPSNYAAGYITAKDKSREIIPREIMDTTTCDITIKTQNGKFRR